MDEGRRQAYLAALGLPLWSSRQALPGALPADPLDFIPWVDEIPPAGELAPEVAIPSVVADAAPPSLSSSLPPAPVAAAAAVVPPAVVKAAINKAAIDVPAAATWLGGEPAFPRFRFWFKPLSSGWQLLIALGDVPDLAAREHQLLEQIEAVLENTAAVAPIAFQWPLNNNPAIPRDAQSAREAVGAFLQRQHREGVRYLLLGRELLPFVENGAAAARLAVGDNIGALLAEPLRKLALWRSLRELL